MSKREIHPPRGTKLTCKNWLIEAPYRMIPHNLDPEVAGDPDNLIVYGGQVFKLDLVMASVVILAVVAALFYQTVVFFEKLVTRRFGEEP